MSKLFNNVFSNPDVARVLCIAIAAEAQKLSGADAKVNSKEWIMEFNRLVRHLDRGAFTEECRKLERQGADRYLKNAQQLLR